MNGGFEVDISACFTASLGQSHRRMPGTWLPQLSLKLGNLTLQVWRWLPTVEARGDGISAMEPRFAMHCIYFRYFPDFAFSAMIATSLEPAYSPAGGSMLANATTV
jgi:hypothetical protein